MKIKANKNNEIEPKQEHETYLPNHLKTLLTILINI